MTLLVIVTIIKVVMMKEIKGSEIKKNHQDFLKLVNVLEEVKFFKR